ncbi:MAG: DUF1949 domain-containing protein [Candidatus Latescibacteria bacterium]|nr:DUF1949 domain-containing protein [Candidatus Latescibacterota bacterium]
MSASYLVPVAPAQVELRFKNSRFIGLSGPATTPEEAKAFIAAARRDYPDASHHVYAFAAGYGNTVQCGMSDDGEPSGTAGRPALAVVQGAEMGDVVVVLVRYFGGTKLGTGGLVKAYTETAQAALAALQCRTKVQWLDGRLMVPYPLHGACRVVCEGKGAVIEAENFAARVEMRLSLAAEDWDALAAAVRDLSAGRIQLERL